MTPTARRIAIVTGGATGIGLACAQALADEGAAVYVASRDVRRSREVAMRERDGGRDLRVISCDVTDERSVTTAFAQVAEEAVRLDVLVNNAGIVMLGRVETLSAAEWDACLDTNLRGAFLCARAAVPLLRASGGGSIVNIASNAGIVARPDEPAYSTSKAGLLMLTRSLALAHAAERIRVNAICPGPVGDTGIMERNLLRAPERAEALAGYLARAPLAAALGRLIEPREVAAVVRFLCSEDAVMITGATIAVDGGKSAGWPP